MTEWLLMQTKQGNRLAAPLDKCTFHLPDRLPTHERAGSVTVIIMGTQEHLCAKQHVKVTDDFSEMLDWIA